MENIGEKAIRLYYQVGYTLIEVPEDAKWTNIFSMRQKPDKGVLNCLGMIVLDERYI